MNYRVQIHLLVEASSVDEASNMAREIDKQIKNPLAKMTLESAGVRVADVPVTFVPEPWLKAWPPT